MFSGVNKGDEIIRAPHRDGFFSQLVNGSENFLQTSVSRALRQGDYMWPMLYAREEQEFNLTMEKKITYTKTLTTIFNI